MEPRSDLEKIRQLLEEAAMHNEAVGGIPDGDTEEMYSIMFDIAEKGCCTISLGGGAERLSNITEQQCQNIADRFNGATFDFIPGQECL